METDTQRGQTAPPGPLKALQVFEPKAVTKKVLKVKL